MPGRRRFVERQAKSLALQAGTGRRAARRWLLRAEALGVIVLDHRAERAYFTDPEGWSEAAREFVGGDEQVERTRRLFGTESQDVQSDA